MNIDDLLTKYFEGETSAGEERQLRAFFASDNVPQRLAIYKPLFAYFDEEIEKRKRQPSSLRRRMLYLTAGVAAGLLLLLGVRQAFFPLSDPCLCEGNYVVINGRCYTDADKLRELAFSALDEVAVPASEYFPERENESDREVIENQLKELSNIFSDDE